MLINVGYPSFLGEKRHIDLIIAPEYSAGDMFEVSTPYSSKCLNVEVKKWRSNSRSIFPRVVHYLTSSTREYL